MEAFFFFFFGHETLKSLTLIIGNNTVKSYAVDFWNKLRLCSIVLIVNPSFEGWFSSMHLLKCEGTLPTFEVVSFHNTLNLNDTSDENMFLPPSQLLISN